MHRRLSNQSRNGKRCRLFLECAHRAAAPTQGRSRPESIPLPPRPGPGTNEGTANTSRESPPAAERLTSAGHSPFASQDWSEEDDTAGPRGRGATRKKSKSIL